MLATKQTDNLYFASNNNNNKSFSPRRLEELNSGIIHTFSLFFFFPLFSSPFVKRSIDCMAIESVEI